MARKKKAAKSAKKRVKKPAKKTPKRKAKKKSAKVAKKQVKKTAKTTPNRKTKKKKKTSRAATDKPTAGRGKSNAPKPAKSAKKTRRPFPKRHLARDRNADRAKSEMPEFVDLGNKGRARSTSVGECKRVGESIVLTFEDREAAVSLERKSVDVTAAMYATKIAFRIAGMGGPDVAESLHDALNLVDRASEEEKSEMMDFVKDSIDEAFERFDYRSD